VKFACGIFVAVVVVLAGCSAGPSRVCPDGGCAGDVVVVADGGSDVAADVQDSRSVDGVDDVPVASDVVADGLCCDPETGDCRTCSGECFPCQGDWQCSRGSRCWIAPYLAGICTSECVTVADCPDSENYTCRARDAAVSVCAPVQNNCPGCVFPTPYLLDGACVECRDSDDCGYFGCCDSESHVCLEILCASGTIYRQDLCACQQCFTDSDCDRFGDRGTGTCLADGTCEGVIPCDGLCTPDFPICAVVGGAEQCVQCLDDEDCLSIGRSGCTCIGDPDFACVDESGAVCDG